MVFVQHVKSATYQITAATSDYDCGKHSPSTLCTVALTVLSVIKVAHKLWELYPSKTWFLLHIFCICSLTIIIWH